MPHRLGAGAPHRRRRPPRAAFAKSARGHGAPSRCATTTKPLRRQKVKMARTGVRTRLVREPVRSEERRVGKERKSRRPREYKREQERSNRRGTETGDNERK